MNVFATVLILGAVPTLIWTFLLTEAFTSDNIWKFVI